LPQRRNWLYKSIMVKGNKKELRYGWTTGACATAAASAAYRALLTRTFPDPVKIILPQGQTPAFALAYAGLRANGACAGVIKDAGDDPDVTHGALIITDIRYAPLGSNISFLAGEGVGTVTRPGLPIPPGEPAINPAPRAMICSAIRAIANEYNASTDIDIEISIPGGREIAKKTWNPRLGIVGGLSILGTTGIVTPYSCSAWIHSIHRGIDVARASHAPIIGAATGKTSEDALLRAHPDLCSNIVDMGDFAGGMLKYLRRHPVPRLIIAGGFAKLTKLAQGHLDLHSARSQVDFTKLAMTAGMIGASSKTLDLIKSANTANEVLAYAQGEKIELAGAIASAARQIACKAASPAKIDISILVVDRKGNIIACVIS
jgi:cobalt-precorrin-5B (C1)-methyltransferase